MRLSAFLVFVPFFNNQNFILPIKVGFGFLVSLLIFPCISYTQWNIPVDMMSLILIFFREAFVGILIGLTILILLFGLQLGGRMMGFQMAFSMARAMDPMSGENTNILAVFLVMFGTIVFLTLGGDHYALTIVKESFELMPPGEMVVTKDFLKELSNLFVHSFSIGFRLASPAIIMLLCVDITLGLLGKTNTKMQIFFVGLPLKIAMGLFSFTIILGLAVALWGKDIHLLPKTIFNFFELMKV